MEFERFEKKVPSSDGKNTLVGTVYVPKGKIKGLFHLVHGMTEYVDRYEPLMSQIAAAGFVCFGFDNLGHGRTAKDDKELGFIASKDGYKYLVDDVKAFADEVRKDCPDLPYTLMGHSMGSFIVRLHAAKYGESVDKLIICGTAGKNPAAKMGLALCSMIKKIRGERAVSPLLEGIAFGAYNKRFEGDSKYEWLTNDREIISKYEQDKYCTFHFTASAMHDLISLIYLCNKNECFSGIKSDMPILLIAGDMDPVGNYGKGVEEVYNNFKTSGHTNVNLKLYKDCRHEIHNDNCKEEMAEDILKFIMYN